MCTFSFYNSFLGYSSFHSSICCKPSSQSPSMEAFLDSAFFSNDLCHAHKPQGSHWHGTTEACHMVCQSLQKEETSFSWRLVWKDKILLSWLDITCLPKDSSSRSRIPKKHLLKDHRVIIQEHLDSWIIIGAWHIREQLLVYNLKVNL